MPIFHKICDALSRLNGHGTVLEDWRRLLGNEYDVLVPFLRATNSEASIYPCPLNNSENTCNGMIIHRYGDNINEFFNWVGYCSGKYDFEINELRLSDQHYSPQAGCDRRVLMHDEVLIRTFDLVNFWNSIKSNDEIAYESKIGFETIKRDSENIYCLGHYKSEQSTRQKVFFVGGFDNKSITNALNTIKAKVGISFIAIFWNSKFLHIDFIAEFKNKYSGIHFIPLDYLIGFDDKTLISLDSIESILSLRKDEEQESSYISEIGNVHKSSLINSQIDTNNDLISIEENCLDESTYIENDPIRGINKWKWASENAWEISFKGKGTTVPNNRGMLRIGYLLKFPCRYFSPIDIVNMDKNFKPKEIDPNISQHKEDFIKSNDEEEYDKIEHNEEIDENDIDKEKKVSNKNSLVQPTWDIIVNNTNLSVMEPLIKEHNADNKTIQAIEKRINSLSKKLCKLDSNSEEYKINKVEIVRLKKFHKQYRPNTNEIPYINQAATKALHTLKKNIEEDTLNRLKKNYPQLQELVKHLKERLSISYIVSYLDNDTKWEVELDPPKK